MSSQNESNIWYFGFNAGLDFNGGDPVVLNDGQMTTHEGCATISDANGQLLFYTDGLTVWDKNHQPMPNGTGLLGHPSSTQAAVIVPKPGSSTIYFIFTSTDLANSDGARYSEVDLSLNSGFGDVTANKNIMLLTPSCEKITAVRKANGEDYWLLLHEYGNNNYRSYSITSAGINMTPVISTTGNLVFWGINDAIGYMKLSPDGTKLINSVWGDKIELFDFDTATGIVNNPRLVYDGVANYGVEFSPSGNIAYITTGEVNCLKLYQVDLTAADIPSTATLLYTAPDISVQIMALQLATNGKIYAAITDVNYLAVINNPEILGAGCGFVLEGISLGTGISQSGLPQFIQSYFNLGINFQNTCLGEATSFSLNANQAVTAALWDFGDGQVSTSISPSHTYAAPGQYMVSVTATSSSGTITKTRQVRISEIPTVGVVSNQVLCEEQGFIYDLSQNDNVVLGGQLPTTYGVAYFASQSNAETHSNPLNTNYSLPIGSSTILC